VIREMTRLAQLHGAVNLSQGFPDFPAPAEVKHGPSAQAIDADVTQLRDHLGAEAAARRDSAKFERLYGVPVDPERQVTVTCGSTEAIDRRACWRCSTPGDE
jgi:aminotransferase